MAPSPTTTSTRPLTEDLHWLAVRLARGLGAAMDDVTRDHGLTLRGYVALSAIVETPGSSQLAIAQRSATDKSVLVGVLDDLERRGLVTRAPDPDDRRARRLQATDAGRATLAAATAAVRAAEDELLATTPPDERETFTRVLGRLATEQLGATFDLRPPASC